MPDFGPLSPILAALVGATITFFVTYFVVTQRRALSFFISNTEDLTLPLQKHNRHVVLRVGDAEMLNLNRAFISVRNRGNVAIKDLLFEIEVPGAHDHAWLELTTKDERLRNAFKIQQRQEGSREWKFEVSAEFLNPKEFIRFVIFFDSVSDDCK